MASLDAGEDVGVSPRTESTHSTHLDTRSAHSGESDSHTPVEGEEGSDEYKNIKSSALMDALQLGIRVSVSRTSQRPQRDPLWDDFFEVEMIQYPKQGSSITPPHHFDSFKFSSVAPYFFHYFRKLHNISTADFLLSLTAQPLKQLSNPGRGGSLLFLTSDSRYLIKTLHKEEYTFLLKLLPPYHREVERHPDTLLPRVYGIFVYGSGLTGQNVRFMVMDNLFPTGLDITEKYDIKGSTLGRRASEAELAKKSPTLKDLDFVRLHPSGLKMSVADHKQFCEIIRRDVLVLRSFRIMDYSLLLGLQFLEEWPTEKTYNGRPFWPFETEDGRKGIAFFGIIDILQSFGLKKLMENKLKSIRHERLSISVQPPSVYSSRFADFVTGKVFVPVENPSLHSSPRKAENPRLSISAEDTKLEDITGISGISSPPSPAVDRWRSRSATIRRVVSTNVHDITPRGSRLSADLTRVELDLSSGDAAEGGRPRRLSPGREAAPTGGYSSSPPAPSAEAAAARSPPATALTAIPIVEASETESGGDSQPAPKAPEASSWNLEESLATIKRELARLHKEGYSSVAMVFNTKSASPSLVELVGHPESLRSSVFQRLGRSEGLSELAHLGNQFHLSDVVTMAVENGHHATASAPTIEDNMQPGALNRATSISRHIIQELPEDDNVSNMNLLANDGSSAMFEISSSQSKSQFSLHLVDDESMGSKNMQSQSTPKKRLVTREVTL